MTQRVRYVYESYRVLISVSKERRTSELKGGSTVYKEPWKESLDSKETATNILLDGAVYLLITRFPQDRERDNRNLDSSLVLASL